MTELDYLKMKLEDKEKAFDKLFKRHMDLLKQQGELEKENEQLKQQLKKDNDVSDNTKQKLRDTEKAFGELFKDYIDALKQKDGLEKKNVQLKKVMNDLKDMLQADIDMGIRSYPLKLSEYLVSALEKIGGLE